MRQEVTRAHKGWALDTVTLHNDVLKKNKEEITAPPAVSHSTQTLRKTTIHLVFNSNHSCHRSTQGN